MKLAPRDRRALVFLAAVVALILIARFLTGGDAEAVEAATDSIPLAEKQLVRLRQISATVPAREGLAQQAGARLAEKEKGLMRVETAEQAQAELLETVRRLGKSENIDARGGELGAIRPLGSDYGEVTVTVSFECGIEQLVNFLAALANQPQLIATHEIQVSAGNPKAKTVNVRLAVSGVVPRKLVPEKKGVAF